jgi:soluble lytic murein transglycosylase-like protein
VFLSDKCKSFDGFIQSCPSLFIKDGGFKNLKGITQDCYDIVLYQIESLESLEGFPDLHGNGQVVLEALTNLTSLKGIGKGVNKLSIHNCSNIKSLDGLEHLDDDVQINLHKTYFNNVIGKNENANVVIKLGDLRELYPEFFTKANESVNEFDYSKMAKVALATAFVGTTPLLMNKLKDKTPEQKAQVLQTAVYDYKKQYNQNSNVTTKVTNVVGKDDESSKSIQDDFKSNGIDMDVIFTIESSNDPKAVNKTTKARGLGQLMKPTWIEVTARLNKKWSWDDAFDPEKNRTVATYYMNKRIPAMLKHYNIPDTVVTRLAAYNWGVGNVKKAYDAGNYEKWIDKAPKETQDYIRKYYKYKSAKITESLHISLIAEKYKCIIRESLIDFPRVGLCSDVWKRSGKSYVLNQSVKDKITSILNDYDTSLIKDIKEIHVAGSIGTNQYDEDTDIDVHLILKEGSYFNNEDQQKLLFKWVKKQRDIKNYYINEHPFEVYIQMNPNQEYLSDALYDVLNDKWLKGPKLESLYFDPYIEYSSIIADVKNTAKDIDLEFGELRRDVIDYETIKSAIANQSYEFKVKLLDKLKIKLAEIEKDTRALLASKKKITDDRKLASQPTSIEQALSDVELSQTWKDKNATFKFMDRYRYLQMITDLEDIMKDKKVSDKEVDTIKKIVK